MNEFFIGFLNVFSAKGISCDRQTITFKGSLTIVYFSKKIINFIKSILRRKSSAQGSVKIDN